MTVSAATSERYSQVAIVLHWLIALTFAGMIGVGFYMTDLDDTELTLKFSLYQWHKSFGVTILILTMCRLGWRLIRKPPHWTGPHSWRKKTAGVAHSLLYLLTLLIPLAGWAMVSVSPFNIPTILFGEIHWPHLAYFNSLPNKASTEATLKLIHKSLAYGTAVLALSHAAAALGHHFILRDGTLGRMALRFNKNGPAE